MAKATTKYSGISVIQMMPMSALRSTPPEKLIEYAKSAQETEKKASRFQADHRATFPALGKIIAALKFHFNQGAKEGNLLSTLTFPEFFKMKTGGKPNNHAESCAKAYGAFVDNGLITEQDYDYCTADSLEKGASIVTKVEGDLTSKHIFDAAEILKTRPKDAIKRLQSIIEAIDGPKRIDQDKAAEFLKLIFGSGHLELVLASTAAEIKYVEDTEKRDRIAGFVSDMARSVGSTPAPAKPAAPAPAKPVEMLTPETWVEKTYGDAVGETDRKDMATDVQIFCDEQKRFPSSSAEFESWAMARAEQAAVETAAS